MTETYYRKLIAPITRRNKMAYQALVREFSKVLIADFAGVKNQGLNRWEVIPLYYVENISKKTGIRPCDLLPEPPWGLSWTLPDDGLAATKRAIDDFKFRRNIIGPMNRAQYADFLTEKKRFGGKPPSLEIAR
jgi:hypothetical protein